MSSRIRWFFACRFVARCRIPRTAALLLVLLDAVSWAAPTPVALPEPIQPRGTLSCILELDHAVKNGLGEKDLKGTLMRIPALASLHLRSSRTSVRLYWQWQGARGAPQYQPQWAELPGPDRYFLLFTWDSERGLFDYYVNGCPTRVPGTKAAPWKFDETATEWVAEDGPHRITDVKAAPVYTAPEAARDRVPADLRFRHGRVFGKAPPVKPLDIDDRRGRLLYETPFSSEEDVRGWVAEGPARIEFRDRWMQMASTRPDATGDKNGHIVLWCPQDFPASFVAEWDIALQSDRGLTIVFFAARGEHGEDIFDPGLPSRDGTFSHYTGGAVESYHISYYANTPGFPGRATSNLRKNNRFLLLASGPVAIPPGSKRTHRARLIKDDAHIQFQVDGAVSIDFTDPGGTRYGPIHDGGKIGLRQMQWTIARYRNFRVWELR